MSWISMTPDEYDKLYHKELDISVKMAQQPEGADGEHTFAYFQDTIGSGFQKALDHGKDVPVERGVSYSELKRMPQMDDSKLEQYIAEQEADDDGDRFEDREDYQSNSDLIAEGNDIYTKELRLYNKAHDVKSQTIHYSDY